MTLLRVSISSAADLLTKGGRFDAPAFELELGLAKPFPQIAGLAGETFLDPGVLRLRVVDLPPARFDLGLHLENAQAARAHHPVLHEQLLVLPLQLLEQGDGNALPQKAIQGRRGERKLAAGSRSQRGARRAGGSGAGPRRLRRRLRPAACELVGGDEVLGPEAARELVGAEASAPDVASQRRDRSRRLSSGVAQVDPFHETSRRRFYHSAPEHLKEDSWRG